MFAMCAEFYTEVELSPVKVNAIWTMSSKYMTVKNPTRKSIYNIKEASAAYERTGPAA